MSNVLYSIKAEHRSRTEPDWDRISPKAETKDLTECGPVRSGPFGWFAQPYTLYTFD